MKQPKDEPLVDKAYNRIIDAIVNVHNPLVIKSTKMMGDTIHVSIIVRHYRFIYPDRHIIWAISEKYLDAYKYYPYATKIVGLPHELSLQERQRLSKRLKNVLGDNLIVCAVGVYGWNTAGDIATQFFYNAKIENLIIPRRPILPIGPEDEEWADKFIKKNKLKRFACMEYNSDSFKRIPDGPMWTIDMHNEFLSKLELPMIWLAHRGADKLKYGVDGRGTTWRQAATLIGRAKVFIGHGSGLTMVAATEGIETPIMEVNIGNTITMVGCGYKQSMTLHKETPDSLASRVNKFMRTAQ